MQSQQKEQESSNMEDGCFAGYVEQFDTLLPELTVAEMLMYTAELKCSVSVRPSDCESKSIPTAKSHMQLARFSEFAL